MNVSVVIPAYNEEKYVARCLSSLTAQIEQPSEILLVDNNCTDKTVEIAKQFDVKIIREKKQGIIFARNAGFNRARGDIIVRTDCDTSVPSDWIQRIKEDFANLPIVALSGPAVFGRSLTTYFIRAMFSVNKLVAGSYLLYGPNYALRKSLWEKVKDEVCADDTHVHEDFDLGLHAEKYGQVYYDPRLVVYTSARRVKDLRSLFGDYLPRWVKTLATHRGFAYVS